MITLLCALALAEEPVGDGRIPLPPPPVTVEEEPEAPPPVRAPPVRHEAGRSLYRAGMRAGLVGGIVATVGTGLLLGGVPACVDGSCAVAGIGAVGLVGGLIAAEVGAPVALAGTGIERREIRERGGDPVVGWSEAGWATWGSQLVLPPLAPLLLPGAYVFAAVQHDWNLRADRAVDGGIVSIGHRPCASRLARCRPAYGVTALP